MNLRLLIIIAVVFSGIYNTVLNIVRFRSASNPTPASVSDVYDSETYAKWKRYSAEHSILNLVSDAIGFVISLMLLLTNLYALFASIFPMGIFWQMFAVILLETIVSTVVGCIVSYISTMKIEEKYGFNKSSMKTFLFDRIRSLILSFLLSLGLSGLIIALNNSSIGDWMILVVTALLFIFTLIISFLYPVFSRIGNKFTPLEEGELKENLMALLTKHGYKEKSIEVMDASRRTTKLNAYFTGFGKMKTIVLYDNLVNSMSTEEICAVFAHELGHGLNMDVLKNQILNIANLLIMVLVAWICVKEPTFYTEFGFTDVNYGFAYILIGALLGFIQPITSLLINLSSRRAEYRADRQAVLEGYGEAMIAALKKLARDNFSHLAPSKLNVALEYSHPPLANRIEAVQNLINEKENENA